MDNPFQAPESSFGRPMDREGLGNTSGMGKEYPVPPGVKGWCWGAFMWNWIWAISNKTWIGLLCFVPFVGYVMPIILGVKGREWAWQNKRWESVEEFNRVQWNWSLAAGIITLIVMVGGIVLIALDSASAFDGT